MSMVDLASDDTFRAIDTALKFSESAIQLSEKESEGSNFGRTIQRLQLDLEETERLLNNPSIKSALSSQKLAWMGDGIHDAKAALNDFGLYVERVCFDSDRNEPTNFAGRARWILQQHSILENRHPGLTACHQILLAILNSLRNLKLLSRTGTPPTFSDSPTLTTTTATAKEVNLDESYGGNREGSNGLEDSEAPFAKHHNANQHSQAQAHDEELPPKNRLSFASDISGTQGNLGNHTRYSMFSAQDIRRPKLFQVTTSEQKVTGDSSMQSSDRGFSGEIVRPKSSISMLSTMSYNEESGHRVSHGFSPFDRSETPTCNPVSPIPPAETPSSGSATLSPLWNERSSTAGLRRYSTNNDFRWEDYPIPVSTTVPSLQSFAPVGRRPRSETLAEMENLSVAVELPAESCSSARHMSVPQMSFPAELSGEISAKEREMLNYRAYKQKPTAIEKPTGSKMRVDIPPSLKPGHLESRNTYPAPPITSYSQFSMTRHLPDQPIEMPHHLHFAAKPPAPYPTEPRMTLTHVSSDPVVPGRRTQMPLQPRPGSMVFPKGFSQNGRGRPY